MPRGLSTAAKAYTGPVAWLADITTRKGTKYYFATHPLTLGSNSYKEYLRLSEPVTLTRAIQTDSAGLELVNADLYVGNLLATEDFEGALCELKIYQLGIGSTVPIFRGRLSEQEEADEAVRFRLISDLDAAQIELHARLYSQNCPWQFSTPGRLTPCGYNPVDAGDVAEAFFGERTANVFSSTTIGDTTLSETVDAHQGRIALLTAGTGKGQKRKILSNTATTFTLEYPWDITPDGTSKFRVFALAVGAPKQLLTSASGRLESLMTTPGARTITDTALAMVTDEHKGETLYIVGGPAVDQHRKIGSNTATTITIDAAEPDFSPAPETNNKYRVLYRTCPKDFVSCEERGRTRAFAGYPTLVPLQRRNFGGRFAAGGGGGGGGLDRADRPWVL